MRFFTKEPSARDRANATTYVQTLIRLLARQDQSVQRYNETVARLGVLPGGSVARAEIRAALQSMVSAVTAVASEHARYSPVPDIATASRAQLAVFEGFDRGLTANSTSVSALLREAEQSRQGAEAQELALLRKLGLTHAQLQAVVQDALANTANAAPSAASSASRASNPHVTLEQWHAATSYLAYDRFLEGVREAPQLFAPFDLWKYAFFTSVTEIAKRLDAVSADFRDDSAKRNGWREAQPRDAVAAILALVGYLVVESIEERERSQFDRAGDAYRLISRDDEHARWLERLFALHAAHRRDLDPGGRYFPSGIEWQLIVGVVRGEYPPLPTANDAAEQGSAEAWMRAGHSLPMPAVAISERVGLLMTLSNWNTTLSPHPDKVHGEVLQSFLGV